MILGFRVLIALNVTNQTLSVSLSSAFISIAEARDRPWAKKRPPRAPSPLSDGRIAAHKHK